MLRANIFAKVFAKLFAGNILRKDFGPTLGTSKHVIGIGRMGNFVAVGFGFDKVTVFVYQPGLSDMSRHIERVVAAFRARANLEI
jgi:hypothetical protein